MQNLGRGTVYHQNEDEDFGNNEEWQDEEFDERVSYASSRVNSSTYVPNQGHQEARGNPRYSQTKDGQHNYQGFDDQYGSGQYEEEGSEIQQIVEETYEEVGDITDPEQKKDFGSAYDQLVEKISHDQNQADLLLS